MHCGQRRHGIHHLMHLGAGRTCPRRTGGVLTSHVLSTAFLTPCFPASCNAGCGGHFPGLRPHLGQPARRAAGLCARTAGRVSHWPYCNVPPWLERPAMLLLVMEPACRACTGCFGNAMLSRAASEAWSTTPMQTANLRALPLPAHALPGLQDQRCAPHTQAADRFRGRPWQGEGASNSQASRACRHNVTLCSSICCSKPVLLSAACLAAMLGFNSQPPGPCAGGAVSPCVRPRPSTVHRAAPGLPGRLQTGWATAAALCRPALQPMWLCRGVGMSAMCW